MRWGRRKAEPELEYFPLPEPQVIRTHIEVDLSELDIAPASIEPSAYIRALALDNAGLFQAYMSVGFHRTEAFQLLQQQLDAVMHRGSK